MDYRAAGVALALCGCSAVEGEVAERGGAARSADPVTPANVLVLVIDDLGVDKVARYGIDADHAPRTPTLDALADRGVLFERAFSSPVCSAARANLVFGRHGWRTGVGDVVDADADFALAHDERSIARLLREGSNDAISTAYVGKWHLGTWQEAFDTHPLEFGFDWHSGAMSGMGGPDADFYRWHRWENGVKGPATTWVDSSHVDDAIDRANEMPEPWAMYVAFAVAHAPYHQPPAWLVSGVPAGEDAETRQFNAMVEALDTEIGRLLAGIPVEVRDRTTVLVIGDNGTNEAVVSPDFDPARQKGTVYHGGVHVPLIAAGPVVAEPGRRVSALVSATDLFATVAELAGVVLADDRPLDSTSLVPYLRDPAQPPLRATVYAERFQPLGFGPRHYHDQMIRDERWELVRTADGDELYDLAGVAVEGDDLLATDLSPEASAAYDALVAALPAM